MKRIASCPSAGVSSSSKIGFGTTVLENGSKDAGYVSDKKSNTDSSCLASNIQMNNENAGPPKKVMLRIKMASASQMNVSITYSSHVVPMYKYK